MSSNRCTIFSTMLIVGGGIFPYITTLRSEIILAIFIINVILTYKYAPGDTEKNPIKDIKKRENLRKRKFKENNIFSDSNYNYT